MLQGGRQGAGQAGYSVRPVVRGVLAAGAAWEDDDSISTSARPGDITIDRETSR